MQKLKRSINMGFRVTAEERDQIMKRMEDIGCCFIIIPPLLVIFMRAPNRLVRFNALESY